MRLGSYLTLSIVACNLLCGTDYTDWNKESYNGGDTITINEENKQLKHSITINNGSGSPVTANIKKGGDCGFIGCFTSGEAKISGQGTIDFQLKGDPGGNPGFSITNGGTLKIDVKELKVNGAFIGTLFNLKQSKLNLTNTSITATRIDYGILALEGGSTITIKDSDINFGSGSIVHQDSTLTIENKNKHIKAGQIRAGGGKTDIKLDGGDIQASFLGNKGSDLKLDMKSSAKFVGNIVNGGTTDIKVKENGTIQGSITASETELKIDLDTGIITGSVTSSATTSKIDAKMESKIGKGINIIAGENTTNFKDNSRLYEGFNTSEGAVANVKFSDKSSIESGESRLEGTSNFTFTDNATIWSQTIISTGTTNFQFDKQAKISGGGIIIKDGTINIDLKDNSSFDDASITQYKGESTIKFDDDSSMRSRDSTVNGKVIPGGINVYDGKTNITFTGVSKMTGNILAGGEDNTVTFTKDTKLDGNLTLDGYGNVNGISKGFLTGTHITGNIDGYDQVTLKITDTKIDGYLHQGQSWNNIGMDATIDNSIITQGFQGKGSSSNNKLSIANSDFQNSDIEQINGSLKAEIVNTEKINDFKGSENAQNIIEMSNSGIKNITQDTGSLDFKTNAKIDGYFKGTANSNNALTITGSEIAGTITQNTGGLALTLQNSTAHENITIDNASFSLYGQNSTAQKDITLTNATSDGTSTNFTLNGTFRQTEGTSNITFAETKFNNTTFLENTTSSNLIFTQSEIKDIQATNGVNSAILTNSKMTNFTGSNGTQAILLTSSEAGNLNQTSGSLTVNGSGNTTINDIKGVNAALIASLSTSTITKGIENSNGATVINLQFSEIKENVKQTNGSLNFSADNSHVKGKYEQSGGTSIVNFTKSDIKQGVTLNAIINGTLNFNQSSTVSQGFQSTNSSYNFTVRNDSKIDKGFTQNQGDVSGSLDSNSKINGGVMLRDGSTHLILTNKSKITKQDNFSIQATNHHTKILLDDSEIDGNITITQGSLDLTAQNKSTVNSPQMQINNADLKLTIDTESKFIGNLTQTNNKQDITVKADSIFDGNITNTDTTGTITVNHAQITGSITQNSGTLGFELSNGGKLGGDLKLENANTTVSGFGEGNEIGRDFTQNNGSLKGLMNGLTLKGAFSQTGGTSEVAFKNSEFTQDTTITNAIKSSLTFINSKLKAYTITGGTDNTLKLLNNSLMEGNLTIKDNSRTTLEMRDSTLKGDIDVSDNSFLTLNTFNSEIINTGKITVTGGGLKGRADSTHIGGDIKLENTTSDIHFTNGSKIDGDITANQGDNTIKFDNSTLQRNLTQTEGKINLDLSNGSSIGGDLLFKQTQAHLTGSPAGNSINGKFTSDESTLTGDASSLTTTGLFWQNKGSADIVFRENSDFKGGFKLTETTLSKYNFINKSGISSNITIDKGENNTLTFQGQSFINNNDTKITEAKITINASDRSSLKGDITAINAISTIMNFDNSFLDGDITQNKGSFNLNAKNKSDLKSNISFTEGVNANLNLNSGSALNGTITATNSTLKITLDNSRFNTIEAPNAVTLQATPLTVTATNNSIFGANLSSSKTATPENRRTRRSTREEEEKEITVDLDFQSGSTYSGIMTLNDVKTKATFNQSTILSKAIDLTKNQMNLSWLNSPNGGTIDEFNANETKLTITSTNSLSTIKQLNANDTKLEILVQNGARLQGSTQLDGNTTAQYYALTNGNLNLDTHIVGLGNTLTVLLNGGMMQGAITQDNTDFGEVSLITVGEFGGRWAVTDSSNLNSLDLKNNPDLFKTSAIFGSVFNNPLSFVDFTLEKTDTNFSTRMGKTLLARPNNPDGTLPEIGENETYVRQLKLKTLQGDNGLFRVYTDLGTSNADNIYADKAEGNHIIQVYYRADTFRDIGDDRIVVAKVPDGDTKVSFTGTQSDVGLTRYDTQIIKENTKEGPGFEWIIGQAAPSGISHSSKLIGSILQSQYRTFAVEVDSLDRRLGYLRDIKKNQGFWARAYFGRATQEATEMGINAVDSYHSVWTGWDLNKRGLTGLNFLGVFFNYTGINTESKDFKGSASNFALGFYNTFQANSGFYFDILAKYIYTTNKYEISSYALDQNAPDFGNNKFLVNFEMGHTFNLGAKALNSYLQPQFQITSGYIQGVDLNFIDVTGEKIDAKMGGNYPVIMRFGAFWGKWFEDVVKTNLKVGTSFVYDVNSGGQLDFSDSAVSLHRNLGGDFRMLFSAHADFLFAESFRMYSSFDTSFFGNYNTTFNFNLGMRVTFGRRNDTLSNVPLVYDNTYVPPRSLEPTDDPRSIPVVQKNTTKDLDYTYMGKPRRIETKIPGNPVSSPYDIPQQQNSRKSPRDGAIGYYDGERR